MILELWNKVTVTNDNCSHTKVLSIKIYLSVWESNPAFARPCWAWQARVLTDILTETCYVASNNPSWVSRKFYAALIFLPSTWLQPVASFHHLPILFFLTKRFILLTHPVIHKVEFKDGPGFLWATSSGYITTCIVGFTLWLVLFACHSSIGLSWQYKRVNIDSTLVSQQPTLKYPACSHHGLRWR